jgi:hypothetical protein
MREGLIPGVSSMISAYQSGGEHLRHQLPGIVCCGVPLPANQVLQLTPPPEEVMPHDRLDLIFFISVYHFWGWSVDIGPVFTRLAIRGQQ